MKVEYTAEILKNLRKLARSYRHIEKDFKPLLNQLTAGETPGDKITAVGYSVYKVRVKNSDIQKGKSAGYRVIYYLRTEEACTLITAYSKSDQQDMPANLLKGIIEQHLVNTEALGPEESGAD